MKKSKLLLLTILLISSGFVLAQNPKWIMPNKYVDVANGNYYPLPTANDYDGHPATCASNMQMDANGNILFFIVDDKIYEREGFKIGDLTQKVNNGNSISGSSEIVIIPKPDSCNVYYILTAGSSNYHNGHTGLDPYVATLDFNQKSIQNSNKYGRLTKCVKVQSLLPPSVPVINLGSPNGSGDILFAASKLRNDNSRLVFMNAAKGIYHFKVDANGFSFDDFSNFSPYIINGGSGWRRGEMELVEINNGPVAYRLAVPIQYNINDPLFNGFIIYVADLDNSGNVVSTTAIPIDYLSTNNLEEPIVKGLEFSPNGKVLYFTHIVNLLHPDAFEFYDFANPSSGIQPVPNIKSHQSEDFQFSQIELGKDGKLYLAYANGLASLKYPNTPSSSVFTANAVPFTYTPNYLLNPTNYPYTLKSYMLPDQIDGMDYQSIAPTIYNITSYTAQSSATWQPNGSNPWNLVNMEVFIGDELIIPNNVNVTIKDMTFHFAPDAKVIIQPGGKLTLDGSTFTNNSLSCASTTPEFWQGVQVWGTSNKSQYPPQNPTYQGMLVLNNGGTIEYAREGACNWKPNDYNKIGGVIQSNGGKFINNSKDVGFAIYENFVASYPSIKLDDFSKFTNTDFISNNDYIELSGDNSKAHVTLWNVHGINFSGCHFANNKTGAKWNSATPNKGIYSVDASFTVTTYCTTSTYPCPANSVQKSSFTGLFTGVEADGAGTIGTVQVTQAEFNNIVNGVFINEIDNASINRNNISLSDPGYNQYPTNPMQQIGVKINNSTGFIVEENNISSLFVFFVPESPYSYGIIINNSGTANNRVYKNNLNKLRIGTAAYAINYEPTTTGDPAGLQFLCNTYSKNKYDIYVGDISGVDDGIRLFQGSYNNNPNARIPAGNIFSSPNTSYGGSWNLDNHNGTHIDYLYNPLVLNTEPINTNGNYNQTTKATTTSTNTCPSSYGNGGIIIQPISFLITETDSLKNVYNGMRYNYLSLIDGGNTELLQQAIDNSWSDDAWTLRNHLIEKSPYLSTETLLKVAMQEVLPNAMLLEVLLANPDATRGPDFIDKLKEASHYSFPQYMIDYVKNNRDAETTRTNLEGQMGGIQTQIALNQNIVKHRNKISDSLDLAERKATTEIGNSIFDKIGRADYFISQEQWSNAKNIINGIKNNDTLKDQLDLIAHFEDYITFRESLGERKISQLDSSEIEQLKSWAKENGRVAGYAQNILCFFYNTCYSDSLTVDEDTGSSSSNTTNTTPLNEVLYNLTISPNPATSSTSIQWTIYDQLENCSYEIQNLNDGVVVAQGSITQNEGSATINVNQFINGYYVVKIINNGQMKVDKKLVVK